MVSLHLQLVAVFALRTYVFSVVALKPNGARRSRGFRVAQTRIHRGYAEAQEVADGEAA